MHKYKDLSKDEKKELQKKFRIFSVILSIPILLSLLILLLFGRQYDLNESLSPDGNYKIIAKYRDTRAWPFGPHDIYISYKSSRNLFTHNLINAELFNDGKTPDENNCIIKWNGSIANITLIGEEQENEKFEINFKTLKVSKIQSTTDEN